MRQVEVAFPAEETFIASSDGNKPNISHGFQAIR